MKSTKTLLLVMSLGVLVLASGCSKNNLPCDTDPSQIEGARAELKSAEEALSSAQSQLASAKSQKDDLSAKLRNLPDTDDLEAKLEDLKKGSGR